MAVVIPTGIFVPRSPLPTRRVSSGIRVKDTGAEDDCRIRVEDSHAEDEGCCDEASDSDSSTDYGTSGESEQLPYAHGGDAPRPVVSSAYSKLKNVILPALGNDLRTRQETPSSLRALPSPATTKPQYRASRAALKRWHVDQGACPISMVSPFDNDDKSSGS